jgi:hypothetical protein
VTEPIPVLIMMPPHGSFPAEKWVARGIQAAGLDLIRRLIKIDLPVYVLAAEKEDQLLAKQCGATLVESHRASFQFGQALIDFILDWNVDHLAYFGAGSAPLLTEDMLKDVFEKSLQLDGPYALVNNFHSTDWAVIMHIRSVEGIADRLPSDNQLGWVLQNEFGFTVETLPISGATRADIDTPSDLLMMHGHPHLGLHLLEFYSDELITGLDHIKTIQNVLTTPASHLTLIGRASAHLWHELERKTQIWIRMFVEERGMVASGRLERGEVRSLIAEIVDQWGPKEFIRYLDSISNAVLWDTRVWMAHHGGWPSKADRFAADLGWAEEIVDPPLKELTQAVNQANIPIITGGHGVVAGGLYALMETISSS